MYRCRTKFFRVWQPVRVCDNKDIHVTAECGLAGICQFLFAYDLRYVLARIADLD